MTTATLQRPARNQKKRRGKWLREDTAGAGRVNREAGVISDCAILGSDSENNREYTEAALHKAARLYEGVVVRIDHKPGERRSVLDDIGVLRNVKASGGKVRGDFVVNRSHPAACFVFERAERFPESFGFSHEAEGLVEEDESGKEVVVDLIHVESVDLVGTPATNKSLFESHGDVVRVSQLVESLRRDIRRKSDRLSRRISESSRLLAQQEDRREVQAMFEEFGFAPSEGQFRRCLKLPARLRAGYVDELRSSRDQDQSRAEIRYPTSHKEFVREIR